MIYVPKDFVSSDELLSAEGQGFTLDITFCRDCRHHHTYDCPMFIAEVDPFTEEVDVLSDVPDNGFCHVGEPK